MVNLSSLPRSSRNRKVRPILVLEVVDCTKEIIAAKITSKPPRNDTNDIEIEEWQQAWLRCLSTVRLDYLFKIPFDQLLREVPIGTVSKDLFIQVLNNFTSYHRRV